MRGTFANNVNELLGRAAHGKGVYLRTEEGLKVDIYCYLNYGVWYQKLRCSARPCETTSLIYDRY